MSAVRQMAILLDPGRNTNSQRSSAAEGAGVTLDMLTASFVGARTFITSARGCSRSELVSRCGVQGSEARCETGEGSKTSHERDESAGNHASQEELPGAQFIYSIKQMIRWCLHRSLELLTAIQPFAVD